MKSPSSTPNRTSFSMEGTSTRATRQAPVYHASDAERRDLAAFMYRMRHPPIRYGEDVVEERNVLRQAANPTSLEHSFAKDVHETGELLPNAKGSPLRKIHNKCSLMPTSHEMKYINGKRNRYWM